MTLLKKYIGYICQIETKESDYIARINDADERLLFVGPYYYYDARYIGERDRAIRGVELAVLEGIEKAVSCGLMPQLEMIINNDHLNRIIPIKKSSKETAEEK